MKHTNKAFTLAELLGVIIILGLLSLLIVPTVNKTLGRNKEDLYQVQIHNIEKATKDYALKNMDLLPESEGEFITITLGDLKKGGFIQNEVRNPITKELFPNDMEIKITFLSNDYVYEVQEDTGTKGNNELPNGSTLNDPMITLIGDKLMAVNLNGTFDDPGAKAKTKGNQDITYTTEISKDGTIVSSIDTGTQGTYIITYKASNNGKEVTTKRTVKVDDFKPEIEITAADSGYVKRKNVSINIIPIAPNTIQNFTYTINGGTPVTINGTATTVVLNESGTYSITVNVTDSGNNTATKTVENYKVDSEGPVITFETDEITLEASQVKNYDMYTGMTIVDNIDGTIVPNATNVTTIGSLFSTAGRYTITYKVKDNLGNESTATRTFIVKG